MGVEDQNLRLPIGEPGVKGLRQLRDGEGVVRAVGDVGPAADRIAAGVRRHQCSGRNAVVRLSRGLQRRLLHRLRDSLLPAVRTGFLRPLGGPQLRHSRPGGQQQGRLSQRHHRGGGEVIVRPQVPQLPFQRRQRRRRPQGRPGCRRAVASGGDHNRPKGPGRQPGCAQPPEPSSKRAWKNRPLHIASPLGQPYAAAGGDMTARFSHSIWEKRGEGFALSRISLISAQRRLLVHQRLVYAEEGEFPRGQQPAALSSDVYSGEHRGLSTVPDPSRGPHRPCGLVAQEVERAGLCDVIPPVAVAAAPVALSARV